MINKRIAFCLLAVLLAGKSVKGQVNPFGNPLVPDMIADASIQEIDGVFYCLCHYRWLWTWFGNIRTACGMEIKGFLELEF